MVRRLAVLAALAALLSSSPADAEPVGEIKDPAWTAQPSPKQRSAVYPFRAMANEKIGVAIVRCAVDADGRLDACSVACETPPNWGFGAAAMKLARSYKMNPTLPDGRSVEGATVALPFFFNLPFLQRLPLCDAAGT